MCTIRLETSTSVLALVVLMLFFFFKGSEARLPTDGTWSRWQVVQMNQCVKKIDHAVPELAQLLAALRLPRLLEEASKASTGCQLKDDHAFPVLFERTQALDDDV